MQFLLTIEDCALKELPVSYCKGCLFVGLHIKLYMLHVTSFPDFRYVYELLRGNVFKI
jgi:hypothetical protein